MTLEIDEATTVPTRWFNTTKLDEDDPGTELIRGAEANTMSAAKHFHAFH